MHCKIQCRVQCTCINPYFHTGWEVSAYCCFTREGYPAQPHHTRKYLTPNSLPTSSHSSTNAFPYSCLLASRRGLAWRTDVGISKYCCSTSRDGQYSQHQEILNLPTPWPPSLPPHISRSLQATPAAKATAGKIQFQTWGVFGAQMRMPGLLDHSLASAGDERSVLSW